MHQDDIDAAWHVPVLLRQVLDVLGPRTGESYLDLTAGYGGHARAVLDMTSAPERMTLVDRDAAAIDVLSAAFAGPVARIIHADFETASRELLTAGTGFDMILADLGVSSPHLNEAQRGFSIAQNGPLDMRMDRRQTLTAADIVNTYAEADLADLLTTYGEEPKARAIARLIAHNRPYVTTHELAQIVARAWPGHSKVHPATRTFQALRIAVNDELGLVERSLPLWIDLLNPGGRLAVISFHSLEDRLVKRAFSEAGGSRYDASLRILTKRPITAEPSEIVFNPRARSAKLRAAVK